MRYRGQGHEIEIDLPDRALGQADVEPLTTAFETACTAQFLRTVPSMQIEILNWSVRVRSGIHHSEPPAMKRSACEKSPCSSVTIHCEILDAVREARVIPRNTLCPGDRLTGPSLITEPQTTTYVAADFSACVDVSGNLLLSRIPVEQHAV
jgi:N-methylhydantoinase A